MAGASPLISANNGAWPSPANCTTIPSVRVSCQVIARASGVPIGAVLEGGYEPAALAASVAATMAALAGDGEAVSVPAEHELTPGAAAEVSRFWPL